MDNMKDDLKEALLKKATGYEYEETEITASKDGKSSRVKKTKKHMPPDLNAIKYLSMQRCLNLFTDKE